MGFQNDKSPYFGNFGSLGLGVLRKMTFGCSPMANHREYYKGEGGGFPQVQVVASLVNLCMIVVHSCTKSVITIH